jgi:hypothetical protein
MEARDLRAVVESFAPDAVFRSPFTDRLCFIGREQIAELVEVLFEVFEDLRYIEQSRVGNLVFLTARVRVGGRELEIVDRLQLGPDGQIEEMTVFFRPLPASAVALRLIGAGLARRKSRLRSALLSTLARPLAFMARTGDRIGVPLVQAPL